MVAKGFFGIAIGNACGDNADGCIMHFYPVDGTGIGVLFNRLQPFFHHRVTDAGVAGHHHIAGRVFHIFFHGYFASFGEGNDALRMGNTGGKPEKNRGFKLLGKLICQFGVREAFTAVCRFQHGNFGGYGVMPGILFVLGRMHAGIVGNGNDYASVDAYVRGNKQRVSSHVESYMLHAAKASCTRQRRTQGAFQRDLFIGCPFGVYFFVCGGVFGNFRTGSTGIAGNKRAARFIKSACNSFISQHNLFFIHDIDVLSAIYV